MEPRSHQPVLLLKRAGEEDPATRLMPISLGHVEAFSIITALQGAEAPRPQTHDLMANVMTTLQAEVERIEIHSYDEKDGTYYASLTFNQHGVTFVVDARPSDAVALAIRKGAPAFVDDAVFESTSVQTNVVTMQVGGRGVEPTGEALSAIHAFAENVQPCDFD
ncbi:MAG: bifunctional nuclease family protein [Actinomycetes bacterium]|nr:bifunctional nuclease family protein [Actinomycetes bacterium]